MALAHGLAIALAQRAEEDYSFQCTAPIVPSGGYSNSDTVTGGWSLVGTTNEVVFVPGTGQDDPQMTKGTAGDAGIQYLRVRFAGTLEDIALALICHINHSTVVLSENDTIVYSDIKIQFETDDFV